MNKVSFVCDICGKTIAGLDEYVAHVKECGAKEKAKLKAEENKKYLEEVNAAISKVKAAEDYYKTCLKDFKEKYPKEYELNFGTKSCGCDCNCNDNDEPIIMGQMITEDGVKDLTPDEAMKLLGKFFSFALN